MPQTPRPLIVGCLLIAAACSLHAGCQSTYFAAMEKMGWHKRDLLADRVKAARDEQEEAKEQFASALEQFQSVVNFKGGELQDKYDKLKTAYERSDAQARAVSNRIDSIESVGQALFKEWEGELAEFESDRLRSSSAAKMRETRQRYENLVRTMRSAEAKMQPVLGAFRDQVLFLKHNLNAQAIASLQGAADELGDDVAQLIREMEASIAESNAFIDAMGLE